MAFKVFLFAVLFFSFTSNLLAQKDNSIYGKVIEYENGEQKFLPGVNIYWVGSQLGTTTDINGNFEIKKDNRYSFLVASFVGYKNDTILVNSNDSLLIVLEKSVINLDDVVVTHRQKGINFSTVEPIKFERINQKELLKAACCNLSESFETNPSVDVAYNDAITGTKQIQMLGLAGTYIFISRENMPYINGLSSAYGLTFIPGPWINSILLNKGTGSVVNGYESISGQIDVQLKKPDNMDRLYLNAYVSSESRVESNVLFKNTLNKHISNATFLHLSNNSMRFDHNKDGFIDMPLSKQFNLLNRIEYNNERGIHFETGLRTLFSENTAGQLDFNPKIDKGSNNVWGMYANNNQVELWSKIGKINVDKPWQSFGLQISGLYHNQNSYFGLRTYDALQRSYYLNFIYQGIIGNTANKFKTGISLKDDKFDEHIDTIEYTRKEYVSGLFYEYTYDYLNKYMVVAGIRIDYHSLYGFFLTPRLNMKYNILSNLILRASAGRGLRTASVFAENISLLASSRKIILNNFNNDFPYGLKPEIAWNYGFNLTYNFTLDYRQGSISVDIYRTDFENQVIVDIDKNPHEADVYNLVGKSFSNSLQFQGDYELIKRLDLRLAYRYYDVKTTYSDELLEKPLTSKHRFLANLSYNTRNFWNIDLTINTQGPKRIPNTKSNPDEYKLAEYSQWYSVVNIQISKTWKEKFEAYIGVENVFDYRQKKLIVAADDPFGKYFDSSIIWGPVFGRNFYLGLRYKLK